MTDLDSWDEPPRRLVLDLDGFAGPLDLLLTLAREQKVDLARISLVALVDQFLAFVQRARRLEIDLAAEHLVMAAWLAYLKSRLLLPDPPPEEVAEMEADAAELLDRLTRLEALRVAARRLAARPRLGVDVFARADVEDPFPANDRDAPVRTVTLFDLIAAYARQRRAAQPPLRIAPTGLVSMDEAMAWLDRWLGRVPEWADLMSFLPRRFDDPLERRSACASLFTASLEVVRDGRAEIAQSRPFAPILLKSVGVSP
jgi:segregation and condensation protein A